MRRVSRRRRPQGYLVKPILLLLAVGALAVYGRFGSVSSAYHAITEFLFPEVVTAMVSESAPPLPTGGKAENAVSTESANPFEGVGAEQESAYAPEIRNDTSFPLDLQVIPANSVYLGEGSEPQVLIVHTHTSEAYTPDDEYPYIQDDNDRTLDPSYNVTRIGEVIMEELEAANIVVLHDTTINDYPSYNDSYNRMLTIIASYLEEYPSIKVVLDIHRDAVIYDDGSRYAARALIDGEDTAQVMLVVGTDDGGRTHREWKKNLAFALELQTTADERYPGLMRPVNLRSSRFNQHVSPGALIVEVGASGNTLGEALRGAKCFADVLIKTLQK